MPRLVRRRPLAERVRSYLNPWDFLLWLSEEIDGHDWDAMEKDWGLVIGISVNLLFLVARANSRSSGSQAIDDVFGDDEGVPWLSWLVSEPVVILDLHLDLRIDLCASFLGYFHHSCLDDTLHRECDLHLLSQALLPHVRNTDHSDTRYTICPARSRQLESNGFITISIPGQCAFHRVRRVQSSSPCGAGCMGACDVGSSPNQCSAILLSQPGTCPGLLALSADSGVRPSAQRHHRDDGIPHGTVVRANVLHFFLLHTASEGLGFGAERGFQRI